MAVRIEKFLIPLWLASAVGSGTFGAVLGLLHSPALAMVGAIVFACGFVAVSHNLNFILPQLRKRDDHLVLNMCEAGAFSFFRQIYRWLPSDPRCRVCLVPFGGVGKLLMIRPSRKNNNLCTECMDAAPVGVHEMDAGILHVDLRGFTAWSELQSPLVVSESLSRYYSIASRVLSVDDSLIEFVGDQVMAIYLPAFPSLSGSVPKTMLHAAGRLVQALEADDAFQHLQVGIGIHFGSASVGNISKGAEKDFTAAGDVVNTAARLQASAEAGQIVISQVVAEGLGHLSPEAGKVEIIAKGKAEPIAAYVLSAEQCLLSS